SSTRRVTPAKSVKFAAECLALPGQGCARQQHRQRCGQQHSHRFLLRLGQRRSTLLSLIIYVTRIRLQANFEHGLGLPPPAPPAPSNPPAPRQPPPPPAAAPPATPAPRIRWPELIEQSLGEAYGA